MSTDRKGYYLKPGLRATAPGSLFIICASTIDTRDQPRPTWGFREMNETYAMHTTYRRGKWSTPIELRTVDPYALHKWVTGHAQQHRRNYIICPVASDVLTLSRFWEFADKAGIAWQPRNYAKAPLVVKRGRSEPLVFRRLVLKGKPDIIHYQHRKKVYVWLSGVQYFADGPPTSTRPQLTGSENITSTDGLEVNEPNPLKVECRTWCRAIQQLADWWRKTAKAPWGMTAGQLALGVLRSHIKRGDLCSHQDKDTHKLERAAQHGGRASLFWVGSIGQVPDTIPPGPKLFGGAPGPSLPGPVVCLDCRSMYPSILRDQWFPVRLIGTGRDCSPQEPQELARSLGVVARVVIETDWPEFPRRAGERVTYPTGRFLTTLTGPELLALRDRGQVLHCHQLAVYQLGTPFRAAAEHLLTLRAAARATGDQAGETFAKLLANSMGGKLAQKRGGWAERRYQVPETDWGEFTKLGKDGKTRRRFRSIGGLCFEWVPDRSSAGPFGAAFAYLTAYGRLFMASIREKCPPRTVYAQDTDGIWCHPDAVKALKRRRVKFGDLPGQVHEQERAEWARWWGPRHYVTDAGWVLSGFYQPTVDAETLTISDSHTVNPVNWSPDEPPVLLVREHRKSVLKAELADCSVDPWGWVTPHQVRQR